MLDFRKVWIAKAGEPPACGVPVKSGVLPTIPSSGWVDGKTIEEVNAVLQNKFGFAGLWVDKDLPDALEKANAVGSEMARIFKQGPKLTKDVLSADKKLTIKILNKDFLERANERFLGMYHFDGVIEIAGKTLSSAEVKLHIGGASVTRNSFRGLLRHEFGHYLESVSSPGMNLPKWGDIHSIFYTPGGRNLWGKVSLYAKTSRSEAFAESFAAYTHPSYNKLGADKLPEAVETWVRKAVMGT